MNSGAKSRSSLSSLKREQVALGDRRSRRRDFQIRNNLFAEALERRRGDLCAPTAGQPAVGVMHDDGDGDLGIAGGEKADEGTDVVFVGVFFFAVSLRV